MLIICCVINHQCITKIEFTSFSFNFNFSFGFSLSFIFGFIFSFIFISSFIFSFIFSFERSFYECIYICIYIYIDIDHLEGVTSKPNRHLPIIIFCTLFPPPLHQGIRYQTTLYLTIPYLIAPSNTI